MKAAFLTAPQKYEIREIEEPKAPSDGLVLKVEACGVCGSDLRRWREGPPAGTEGIIAGHEISGVVVEVGEQVSRFKVGEKLAVAPDIHCGCCYFCENGQYNLCDNLRLIGITPGYPGGFAGKVVLSGEILRNGIVHTMPQGLSFLEGALAEPASSVLASHDRASTDLRKVLVVMGGGPIGCLHIVIAGVRGASVILSEPNPDRREMAKAFSPALILDPSGEDVVNKVKEFTSGRGADIVICANPVAETQTQAVEMVRKGGKVILFGGLPKKSPMTNMNGNLIHYGEIEVAGSFSYHPAFHSLALDVIARGLIPVEKLVTHRFPLDEINEAFQTAASGKALKVIIQILSDGI
jgi:L-iditol 2-dehydrogenase